MKKAFTILGTILLATFSNVAVAQSTTNASTNEPAFDSIKELSTNVTYKNGCPIKKTTYRLTAVAPGTNCEEANSLSQLLFDLIFNTFQTDRSVECSYYCLSRECYKKSSSLSYPNPLPAPICVHIPPSLPVSGTSAEVTAICDCTHGN